MCGLNVYREQPCKCSPDFFCVGLNEPAAWLQPCLRVWLQALAGGVVNVSLRNVQKVSPPPVFQDSSAMDKFHRGQTDIKFQTRLHPMWEDCCG